MYPELSSMLGLGIALGRGSHRRQSLDQFSSVAYVEAELMHSMTGGLREVNGIVLRRRGRAKLLLEVQPFAGFVR